MARARADAVVLSVLRCLAPGMCSTGEFASALGRSCVGKGVVPKPHTPSGRSSTRAPRREAQSIFDSVGSRDKQIVLLPGGAHGTTLVEVPPYGDRTRALILEWIESRAGRAAWTRHIEWGRRAGDDLTHERLDVVGHWGHVVFWGAAIAFGVWAVRRSAGRPRSSALRILEERFAKGEIDAEEFERQRALLEPDA